MKPSKELYRRIANAVPEGIWLVTPEGRTIFCNERMAQILGTDIESLQRRSCFDPVFPDDLEEAQRQFGAQMAGGGRPFDFRLRRDNGSPIWVSISCSQIYDDSGVVTGLLGLFTDITERKRAEAMLRESEERFRSMADTAPVMIWVSGPDKLCTFFNKCWLDFTGRVIEQELGNGWVENVHPDDLGRCMDIYLSSFDARRDFRMEYRLLRRDGEYRWLLNNGIPRIEPDGRFAGYIGSCIDITDLKRTQEIDLARLKLETVGAMAVGIVHDFGNILAGILGYSEVVLEALARGSVPEKEMRVIRDAATRGADIARQLMVYAGTESEALEPVNVSKVVEDMRELLRASVSKHVAMEIHLDKRLRTVRANPSQIRQILMNLIANASEATDDGVIRVTTGQMTVGRESVWAISERMTPGDYVQLEVSDTGRGMTPEVQARIFDMFFSTKGAGIHGLGLAAVRGLVERFHGTIRLSSAPGKGTTFQIMLPCEKQMAEAPHSAIGRVDDETVASKPARILFVEDDRMLRHAISTMLRKKGFSVVEASDGSAALNVIRTQNEQIDVLLLDISLPSISSREVYEEARRLRPNLHVIITSAYSKETAEESLGETVERFLRKPFAVRDFIEMIREISAAESARASRA